MALFGFLKPDPVAAFWRWFARNADRIAAEVRALRQDEQASGLTTAEMARRLQKIHPSLTHEIGSDADWPIELIISADGDLEGFPAVTRTVGAAPALPGFQFTAFRKRVGPEFMLGMFGHEIRFRQVRYESWPEDDRLGVRLHIAVEGLEDDELDAMAFILLDMALGEYDVATGLGGIEVATGSPTNAKPLTELAAEFDAYRAPTVH